MSFFCPYIPSFFQLFREDEYGRVADTGYSAQRSYTGQVWHFWSFWKLFFDMLENKKLRWTYVRTWT